MSFFKKLDEQAKLQKIIDKKNKSFNAKIKRETIFTTFKPWHAIFIMIMPTIVSVIIFSTYQIIDKLVATNWGGASLVATYGDWVAHDAKTIINIATTYAAVPSSIALSFSLLISIGTSVKFSITYGKNKTDKMAHYLGNGFLSSFLISIIFMATMYFLVPFIIKFQSGTDQTPINQEFREIIVREAIKFSRILVFGSPLLFFSNFWLSLLRSEGRVVANIVIILISSVINLGLDFIFVIPGNLGMAGTAYATAITWFLIFIMAIILIYYSGSNLKFGFRHLKLKKSLVLGILIIGLSSLLENVAQSILAMVTARLLNSLPGPVDYPSSSSMPIYLQLYGSIVPWLILINAPVIGVSQGARALIGYVYGSRNYYRVWQLIWRLFLLLVFLLTFSLLLVIAAGDYMMNAFGVDLAMAKNFKVYIIMQFAFYPLASLHFIAIIFYQGINRAKIALFASLQKTIIMPIIALVAGYFIAIKTDNGFYFYVLVGMVDLFAAFVLLPLLLNTLVKTKTYLKKPPKIDDTTGEIRAVETLKIKQK